MYRCPYDSTPLLVLCIRITHVKSFNVIDIWIFGVKIAKVKVPKTGLYKSVININKHINLIYF